VLDELLNILAARQVRATFFIVGSWARANPERVAAIQAGGHQVGNHSYSHCNLSRLNDSGIVEDLTECRQVLEELGIESRPWFRAPYGEMTSSSRVSKAVKQAGYRHVPWNVDSEDWRADVAATEMAQQTVARVRRRWPRTAIVLFHSWPEATPGILSLVLDELKAARATFVSVGRTRHRLLVG
jgi:peptidoglycan-N-acetylglucosamine deacetylase